MSFWLDGSSHLPPGLWSPVCARWDDGGWVVTGQGKLRFHARWDFLQGPSSSGQLFWAVLVQAEFRF